MIGGTEGGPTGGGASDGGSVTTTGGISGGGSAPASASNTVPGTTGAIARVAPTRNIGRRTSSRAATNAGEGSASTASEAVPAGAAGRPVKPAGSITRASCTKGAQVVFVFENCCGAAVRFQISPGASGPHPAICRPYSQYTSPGLN